MERPYNYESITTLNISNKNLTELPSWVSECKNLEKLNCSFNKITLLNNLPPTLNELYCNNNKITNLNNLPQTLKILYCSSNIITQLDNLPLTLKELSCGWNQITQLDNLPENVNLLWCINNPLKYAFEITLENIKNYNNQNKLPK